jgi:hypothetical protein
VSRLPKQSGLVAVGTQKRRGLCAMIDGPTTTDRILTFLKVFGVGILGSSDLCCESGPRVCASLSRMSPEKSGSAWQSYTASSFLLSRYPGRSSESLPIVPRQLFESAENFVQVSVQVRPEVVCFSSGADIEEWQLRNVGFPYFDAGRPQFNPHQGWCRGALSRPAPNHSLLAQNGSNSFATR